MEPAGGMLVEANYVLKGAPLGFFVNNTILALLTECGMPAAGKQSWQQSLLIDLRFPQQLGGSVRNDHGQESLDDVAISLFYTIQIRVQQLMMMEWFRNIPCCVWTAGLAILGSASGMISIQRFAPGIGRWSSAVVTLTSRLLRTQG